MSGHYERTEWYGMNYFFRLQGSLLPRAMPYTIMSTTIAAFVHSGVLDDATCQAHGHNPLCGDQVTIYLAIEGDIVREVGFTGEGCAISMASASMLTAKIKDLPVAAALDLVEDFRKLVMGRLDPNTEPHALGHLAVFQGVSALPVRIKCALLPWHALQAALNGDDGATTEGTADPFSEGESA